MKFWDSFQLEIIKWILGILSLLITWVIGQKILLDWEEKKKKKELDITTINQFQHLYGEFRSIWRVWRACKFHTDEKNAQKRQLTPPDNNLSWELLDRASKAEGGVEAILIKIATERRLCQCDLKCLGLFRQAFQTLRQDIRENKAKGFSRTSPEYYLFDELSCEILNILSFGEMLKKANSDLANKQYREIKNYSRENWDKAVENKREMLEGKKTSKVKNIYQNSIGEVKYK